MATGTFSYTVADPQGAQSQEVLGMLQVRGTNDAPILTSGAVLNISEDDVVIGGNDVEVGNLTLLSQASDIDDADFRLFIAEVNGDAANVDNNIVITLSYTDSDGAPATQALSLAVRSDGTIDLNAQAIQQLGISDTATGTFTYKVSDASGELSVEQTATINLLGSNDQPQFRGDVTADISAAAGNPAVSGRIFVDDIDQGENSFQIPSVTAGIYGTWSFNTSSGQWTYTLNSNHAAVTSLASDQKLTDTITLTSTDGTVTRDVSVDILGAASAPVFSVQSGDVVNLTLSETNASVQGKGSITLSDANTFESVNVAVTNVSATGSTSGLMLTERELAALLRVPQLAV